MTIEEIKKEIETNTGVPATLLTGETAEENLAQAKALLAYKREVAAEQPKDPRDQFKEWLQEQTGEEPEETPGAYLDQLAETLRVEAGGYPIVPDGGTPEGAECRDPVYEFSKVFWKKTAFDPFKDKDGFTPLIR